MIKYTSLLLLLLTFSFLSCEKLNKLTQFDIDYDSNFTIPSSTGINLPANIITPDFSSNSESKFPVNDTHKDLIKSIIVKCLTFSIQSPSIGNFNFLKTVRIFNKVDGLDEILVAYKENMSKSNSITLDLSYYDLQEYIKKNEFDIRVETITDEILSPDHGVTMHSEYFVDTQIDQINSQDLIFTK